MQNVRHTPELTGVMELFPTISPYLLTQYMREAVNALIDVTPEHCDSPVVIHYQYHMYVLIRAQKPDVVVETGVNFGISTILILSAMKMNNKGHLYSCDTEVIEEDRYNLYSSDLAKRWTFYHMSSQKALPRIEARFWDFFLHDSDHGYDCKKFEYDYAWDHVREGGLIASDDYVWGSPPWAWEDFLVKHKREAVTAGHLSVLRR